MNERQRNREKRRIHQTNAGYSRCEKLELYVSGLTVSRDFLLLLLSLVVNIVTMNKSMFKFLSKLAIVILCILGLIELGLALWTILEDRYKSLAYTLSDVGYIVSNFLLTP